MQDTLPGVIFYIPRLWNTKELLQADNFNNSNGIGSAIKKKVRIIVLDNKYELTTNTDNSFYETHLNIDLT
jgi:hypothetical protein